MPFKVTDAHRLQIEADRIQAILEMRTNSGQDWEEEDFITHMGDLGLTYSNPELLALRAELVSRGVLELV